MVISGRSEIKDCEQQPTNKVKKLDEKVFCLLVDMYKKTMPRYAELCSEYEICLRKSRNARKKSMFPPIEKWIPTRGLQDGDLELLQGPTNVASIYRQIVNEDVNTGRQVSYSACESDNFEFEARYSSCFVRLPIVSESTPTFGHISLCFSHTFANSTNDFLLVHPFSTPQ